MTSSEQRQACSITAGSFNDPIVAELTTLITAAGLRLCLFDITSDIGIPCYSALLGPTDIVAMRQLRYPDVTHGSGPISIKRAPRSELSPKPRNHG